jgi:Family of unknown function (DUF6519)/FHA domain
VYGDFSRFPGGPGPYSGVLAQQGRLLLDAELNTQNVILLDYLRRLTTDLIGPFAGPVHHAGFAVEPVIQDGQCRAVRLRRGHYYVYGLRCEAPAPHRPANEELPIGEHEAPFVVYLAVWEQAVSAIQAPELIDPALSADVPDTTRRSQVRWRPVASRRLPMRDEELTNLQPESIIREFHEYNADPHRQPRLGARAHSGGVREPEPGPATAAVPWGYRGVENQLYRVEIHRGGTCEEATFKWSRDNGSVESGLADMGEPEGEGGVRTAHLQRVWRDAQQGLEAGDWVEFVDDHWAPLGTPAALMQVQGISLATRQVTLQDTDGHRDFDARLHPLLRRWDQQPDCPAPNHGIPLEQADRKWFELEDGVQIRFEAPAARYERGDYWLIPARTATSGVLWPQSRDEQPAPLAIPPDGPLRYLAPLALLEHIPGEPVDLRVLFGYRAAGHDASAGPADGSPEPSHPAVQREIDLTDAATVIRPPGRSYQVRSVSTFEPGAVLAVHDGATIGRAPDVGVRLNHPDVSRHHAILRLTDDELTIMDLGSTNGTEVNGQRLPERVPATVSPGDTIQVGSPELQLLVEEA